MKTKKPKKESKLEKSLFQQFALFGIRTPIRQYQFHYERGWLFDFAWPSIKVAVEVQGGIFSGGAHTRGKGYEEDNDKANEAVRMGWRLFRFGPNQVTVDERKALYSPALKFMHGVLQREGMVNEKSNSGKKRKQ